MTSNTENRKLLTASLSGLSLIGGATQSLLPAVILMISARLYSVDQRGLIALILAFSGFFAQICFTFFVESRLTTANSIKSISFPKTVATAGMASGIILIVFPGSVLAAAIAMPLMLASIEVGRGVGISQRHDKREVIATFSVGASMGIAFLLSAFEPSLAVSALGCGVLLANISRVLGPHKKQGAIEVATLKWLLLDVIATGALYPILSSLVLIALGPSEVFIFAAVTTAAGLIGIPVTYLRTRLLQEHSRLDMFIATFAVIGAVIVVLLADFTGLLTLFFGTTWTAQATIIPLALASIWKVLGLWAILPLVKMRRLGVAKLPTILRVVQTLFTLGLSYIALLTGSIALVFLVLCFGEIIQAVMYEIALKRSIRQNASS